MTNTPAAYSEDHGFESRPGNRPVGYLKIGHSASFLYCCIPSDWPIPQEVSVPERLRKMVVEVRFLTHNLQVEPSRTDRGKNLEVSKMFSSIHVLRITVE
jgi:hypothetical protein